MPYQEQIGHLFGDRHSIEMAEPPKQYTVVVIDPYLKSANTITEFFSKVPDVSVKTISIPDEEENNPQAISERFAQFNASLTNSEVAHVGILYVCDDYNLPDVYRENVQAFIDRTNGINPNALTIQEIMGGHHRFQSASISIFDGGYMRGLEKVLTDAEFAEQVFTHLQRRNNQGYWKAIETRQSGDGCFPNRQFWESPEALPVQNFLLSVLQEEKLSLDYFYKLTEKKLLRNEAQVEIVALAWTLFGHYLAEDREGFEQDFEALRTFVRNELSMILMPNTTNAQFTEVH